MLADRRRLESVFFPPMADVLLIALSFQQIALLLHLRTAHLHGAHRGPHRRSSLSWSHAPDTRPAHPASSRPHGRGAQNHDVHHEYERSAMSSHSSWLACRLRLPTHW